MPFEDWAIACYHINVTVFMDTLVTQNENASASLKYALKSSKATGDQVGNESKLHKKKKKKESFFKFLRNVVVLYLTCCG